MIRYLSFEHPAHVDELFRAGIECLHDRIFSEGDAWTIFPELERKYQSLILLAVKDDTAVIGYKIGFEDRRDRFHSWIGGVDPNFRRQGIASELMLRQHAWCAEHGYKVVRTHTQNRWKDMLILNLRHGFEVVGTRWNDRGCLTIVLEKRLG